MSKKDKLLKRFLEVAPKKNLTFNELETLLLSCGFSKIDGAGSAVKFYIIKQIQIKLKEVCNG